MRCVNCGISVEFAWSLHKLAERVADQLRPDESKTGLLSPRLARNMSARFQLLDRKVPVTHVHHGEIRHAQDANPRLGRGRPGDLPNLCAVIGRPGKDVLPGDAAIARNLQLHFAADSAGMPADRLLTADRPLFVTVGRQDSKG